MGKLPAFPKTLVEEGKELARGEAWMGTPSRLSLILLAICVASIFLQAQSTNRQEWKDRLRLEVELVDLPKQPVDQIVLIAQTYKLPMSIEWLDRPSASLRIWKEGRLSVLSVLQQIVSAHPWEKLEVGDSMIRITCTEMTNSPRNFLNIRIPRLSLEDQDLLDARCHLDNAINRELHPEKYPTYTEGGVYSCGGPPEKEFIETGYKISVSNATVREILDTFVEFRQSVLWIVRRRPEDLVEGKAGSASDPITTWSLVPLRVPK